jgi:hypothetical protein
MRVKKFVAILLVAELFIAYFVLAPTCILRHDQVQAFAAWHDNPTSETRAEWDRQKRITELQSLGFSAVVFGVIAGATLFAARIWRQRHPVHTDLKDETNVV